MTENQYNKIFNELRALRREVIMTLNKLGLDDEQFNLRKASLFLGVSMKTVVNLRESGQLPTTKIGPKIVYYKKDLESYRKDLREHQSMTMN